MDRTFGGNLHQLGVLVGRQWTSQFNPDVDPIKQALPGLACFAIFRMNARVPKRDSNVLQRELFTARVEPDGH